MWSTEITYIRMAQGFVYLVADQERRGMQTLSLDKVSHAASPWSMDWFSRFVLSWSLSLTMEVEFCVEALKRALRRVSRQEAGSFHKTAALRAAALKLIATREYAHPFYWAAFLAAGNPN